MLEFIEAQDDVLAVRVGGRITGEELRQMMDRLHQSMARHGIVHVFVETRSLDSIEITNLASYVGDAIPLFRKLRRFGRVAVVADQGWVRTATRLESVLLPGISYRVVEPSERDEALAWVKGEG